MAPAPGKTCGPCTMCCSALEIPELNKPAGPACRHCAGAGGCAIYPRRPQVCRDFECEWLTDRALPATLRPDRVGTILMEADDGDEFRAVCAPEKPLAWRNPLVFAHLREDRQIRTHGGRQGGAQFVAHFRLGRMGADGLSTLITS